MIPVGRRVAWLAFFVVAMIAACTLDRASPSIVREPGELGEPDAPETTPRVDEPPSPRTPSVSAPPSLLGIAVAEHDTVLAPLASGTILELAVGIGDPVAPGQVVARLSDPELGFEVARAHAAQSGARADFVAERARAASAADAHERMDRLGEEVAEAARVGARLEADAARARTESARVRAAERRAEAQRLDARAAALEVRSTVAGVVAVAHHRVGDHVDANAPVFRVVSTGVFARFAVPEADLSHLPVGNVVEVRSDVDGSRTACAVVERVTPEVDRLGMRLFETSPLVLRGATVPSPGTKLRVRLSPSGC